MSTWLLSVISVAYLGLMFVVAHFAEHGMWQSPRLKVWIYTLAMGSCGTSWAYYGTVAQVAQSGWVIAPIYVGTIGFFVLAMPLYRQLLISCKKHNITSIADYLASRYGRSSVLGALITMVIFVGLIPYIALQLRAVAVSFDILTAHSQADEVTAVKVTVLIAIFCIAFGTKKVFTSEQNPGLMSVVALSSLVKLLALTLVGFLIFAQSAASPQLSFWPDQAQLAELTSAAGQSSNTAILSQIVLGALTIFCLPRLFHLLMIENSHLQQLTKARWHLPLYLILSNLFILPIAWFGHQLFKSTHVSTDSFVLMIPMTLEADFIALISYLGGLAAAIAMIVVATIVLSNMIANQVVTPLMLKQRLIGADKNQQAQPLLLMIRRCGIVGVLVLALIFHQSSARDAQLANIGLFSFVLLVQTFPALLCAMLWRNANRVGAISGLCAGTLMWLYTLALPTVMPESVLISDGLFGLSWLRPQSMFDITELDPLSHGLAMSLGLNFVCFVVGSLLARPNIRDAISSDDFFVKKDRMLNQPDNLPKASDLYELILRFVSEEQAELLFAGYSADAMNEVASPRCYEQTQHLLSGVMGGASTRMLLNAVAQQALLPQVVGIASEAKDVLSFNRELLQAGIETIDTGVSVFDYDLQLVAWNKSYQRLLEYPPGFLTIGMSVKELLIYNAQRGILVTDNLEQAVEKRLSHMRSGSTHLHQRSTKSGLVLELRGQPMSGGGYVSSITDITEHIQVSENLRNLNDTLEQRVFDRTLQLEAARSEAERANLNKSRFLAAASHDLMQPFNAASLFGQMLDQQVSEPKYRELVANLLSSLNSAESQLSDLLDISKLDAGGQDVAEKELSLTDILEPLAAEFDLLSLEQGVSFKFIASSLWIRTDPVLLRRIVQNFLSNAVRYCDKSQVTLGVLRRRQSLEIMVIDRGPGIDNDKLTAIFDEFVRLSPLATTKGLGLGLSIAERLARLLNNPIKVRSIVGRGSCFSVTVPLVARREKAESISDDRSELRGFEQLNVLVIDNDYDGQQALAKLLTGWGCKVVTASGDESYFLHHAPSGVVPDLVFADYHLNQGRNGVDLIEHWFTATNYCCPCIINSADATEDVRKATIDAGFSFCAKPIKGLALKRMIKKLTNSKDQADLS